MTDNFETLLEKMKIVAHRENIAMRESWGDDASPLRDSGDFQLSISDIVMAVSKEKNIPILSIVQSPDEKEIREEIWHKCVDMGIPKTQISAAFAVTWQRVQKGVSNHAKKVQGRKLE